jgi:hypothetical protein
VPARQTCRRFLAARLAAALALLPAVALLTAATPVDGFDGDPDRLVLVTVHWANRAQLQQVAGRFSHLRVGNGQTGQNVIWKKGVASTPQAVTTLDTAWSVAPYENQAY